MIAKYRLYQQPSNGTVFLVQCVAQGTMATQICNFSSEHKFGCNIFFSICMPNILLQKLKHSHFFNLTATSKSSPHIESTLQNFSHITEVQNSLLYLLRKFFAVRHIQSISKRTGYNFAILPEFNLQYLEDLSKSPQIQLLQ